MLILLRQIRRKLLSRNKITTYLLYALGEIILVVIGILIAIQIDDWNENRINKQKSREILQNLALDIEEDISGFNVAINFLQSRKNHVDSILLFIEDPSDSVDHELLAHWLITSGYILDYTPVFPTYNEVLSAGKLNLIKSNAIKTNLATYKSRVENNVRITSKYDTDLKKIEARASSLISKTPASQHFISDPYQANKGVRINIPRLLADKELINLLKHNSYYTQVEIIMKQMDYLPLADSIQRTIQYELMNNY